MPNIPTWALAGVFWLHLLATVTWIGSLVSIYTLILPVSRRALQPVDELALLDGIQKRLEPISWFSVSLLIVTGLFQMSVNPHYNGFLSTSGQWSLAILSKHILVAGLIVVSAVHTWDVLPAIRRALMRREKPNEDEVRKLQRRERTLLQASLALAALILLATAFARAS
ncbi:MAG: CopD family protein [Anaerolineales bacterium]